MKKMLLAAAAIAAMASPAVAQTRTIASAGHGYGYGPAWHAPVRGAPVGVYAQSPGIAAQGYGLYRNGQYIGWDPDPAVRLMLLKDAGSEGN
jgi:hypothetical protein